MTSDQQPAYSFIQYPYGEEDLIANKKVQIDILSKENKPHESYNLKLYQQIFN